MMGVGAVGNRGLCGFPNPWWARSGRPQGWQRPCPTPPPRARTWPARCDGQRGYGCGGIRKWNVTCKCVPDAGCGCYRAKISMSGEEYITALTHPANTTYQEIVHEEMKHVNAAKAVAQGLRKDAATMDGRTFRWKFMCEFACSQFRGRATKELADAVSRVHVTDPHPKVMTPGPSEWGFPIRRQD